MASPTVLRSRRRSRHPELRRQVALLPDTARRLRHDALRWSLERGKPLDAVVLTVILGAKGSLPMPLSCWTAFAVQRVCWVEVLDWCDDHGVELPADTAGTLGAFLRYLAATRQLAPGSDAPAVLRQAAAECGQDLGTGHGRRHPAG